MVSEPDSRGDMLLAKYRAGSDSLGFFDLLDGGTDWQSWLEATSPNEREPVIISLFSLAIAYRRERNVACARYWAEIHLRLARTLPHDFDSRESRIGFGRNRYVGDALIGLARIEQLQGAISRAHELLIEAEQCYDAEVEQRRRNGITEQAPAERILSVNSSQDRAVLYELLAKSALHLGDEREARRYHGLWIKYRNDVPTSGNEISELVLKADYFMAKGQPNAALEHLWRAVAIADNEHTQYGVASNASYAYRSMARVYGQIGTPRTALAALDKARTFVNNDRDTGQLANIEITAAHILRDHPALGDALKYLLRALQHHSVPATGPDDRIWTAPDGTLMRVAALDEAWPILLEAAEILEERHHFRGAADFLQMATGVAEQVRNGAFDETSRIAVQDQRSRAYVNLARTQLRLAEESPESAEGFVDAAWQTVETFRARTFLDTLGDGALTSPAGVNADLVKREAEALDRRRQLRLRPTRDAEFWAEQQSVDHDLTETWNAMAIASPTAAEYVSVRQARPASHAEVADMLAQHLALSGDQAVVVNMLFPDDERLVLLAVDSIGRHVRVASSQVDRKRLTKFVTAHFGSADRVRELATDMEDLFHHELSCVVSPLVDLCEPGQTIVICPAAPLHHVPLGAVRLGQDVLLSRNPLVFSPSASMLCSRQLTERKDARCLHSVFGDPSGDLPRARDEAIELGNLWGVPPHLGADASAEALLKALGITRIVHVAAHARFNAKEPLESFVMMADRALSAREILRAQAPSLNLVTLSACESGVYHAGESEDPMGLTRALLFAGADSILASLWRVPDRSAYRLTTQFYGNLRKGTTKAEALRAAMLATREDNARLDRWAAFTLTGAWV